MRRMKVYPAPFQDLLCIKPLEYSFGLLLHVDAIVEGKPTAQHLLNAYNYLESAGFKIDDDTKTGNRGSRLGNMSSFSVSKLITRMQLKVEAEALILDLRIDLSQQILSAWNYIDLQAELLEFAHFVRTGERLPNLWTDLKIAKGRFWKFDWHLASNYWKPEQGPTI